MPVVAHFDSMGRRMTKKCGKCLPSLRVAGKFRPYVRCPFQFGQWGRHSLHTPPRLAGFSLATPSTPGVGTGLSCRAQMQYTSQPELKFSPSESQ